MSNKRPRVTKKFIQELLKKYEFPQISEQTDYGDYTELILALENVNTSQEQYQQELLEVFNVENDEEMITIKKKISNLIEEIWQFKFPARKNINQNLEKEQQTKNIQQGENLKQNQKEQEEQSIKERKTILERIQKKVKKFQPMTNYHKPHYFEQHKSGERNFNSQQYIQSQLQQPLYQMCQLMQTMQQQLQQTIQLKIMDPKPQKIEIIQKQKELCKYYPYCEAGNKCKFHHPTELCKNFPYCPYESKCLYIHPSVPCKYGMYCQRPDCLYLHPQQMQNGYDNYYNNYDDQQQYYDQQYNDQQYYDQQYYQYQQQKQQQYQQPKKQLTNKDSNLTQQTEKNNQQKKTIKLQKKQAQNENKSQQEQK